MIGLWIAAAVLSAAAAALILWRASAVAADGGADPSLPVYRRALAEIDDLAERGLLPEAEREAARAEAARRLLRVAERPAPAPDRAPAGGRTVLAICLATATATLVIYLAIGSPSLPDQPFKARLAAWRARPESAPPAGLAAALAEVADERPTDPEPLRRLAALDLSLGDVGGAEHALRRAMARAPGVADLPAMLGELMVLGASGRIGPEAEALFRQAVARNPNQPAARYYLARAKLASGQIAAGLAEWRALLATLAANDPRRAALAAEIAEVERTGRAPAPETARQASGAGDLGPAVQAMVAALAAQLHAHPDDPGGWVRLVRAYAVLGDERARDAALAQARARYAAQPDELARLAGAAQARPAAGLAR
ncbi:MAG TPA: c-type cytochrome biogenesis protein CcmI [Caulobacteraceae bacterium]|nr:c-type cytochrome biogenesis protein CcmI [Caulobacteraceae bacterium]